MFRKILAAVCLCCVGLLTIDGSTTAKSEPEFHYDRIQLLEKFIKTLYPDLATRLASFQIISTFGDKRGVTVRHATFFPCRFVGSVSVPTIETEIPVGPANTAARSSSGSSGLPVCGSDPTPEFQHFLDIAVSFAPGYQRRPIFEFHASGSYVDAKLQLVRDQFAGKPYTRESETLQVLRSENPKYGPDQREEFLETLQLSEISQLTGCRLHPKSATFVVELDRQILPPDLQWHVSGTVPGAGELPASNCWATFEPFDGHLTLFMIK